MRKKTYRVVGAQRVCDTSPGDTFTTVLEPAQERFLIDGGHIVVVPKTAGANPKEK